MFQPRRHGSKKSAKILTDADVVTYVVTSGHDSVRNVLLDVVSTPSRWRSNVSFINVVLWN